VRFHPPHLQGDGLSCVRDAPDALFGAGPGSHDAMFDLPGMARPRSTLMPYPSGRFDGTLWDTRSSRAGVCRFVQNLISD